MKIISLTKIFDGYEFIEASIEALYDFVDKFVFVNSDVNWLGETGNTIEPVIKKWKKKNDSLNKIFIIDCNVSSQKEQYDVGYKFIKDNFICDWIMLFDADEVWDHANLQRAKKYLNNSLLYNSISAKMHTYLKSPFYRVSPPEMCEPTVFIRPVHCELLGIRGNGVKPKLFTKDLFFHHFTYVRFKEKDVFKKIQTSLIGDREDVSQTQLVDLKKWKKEKWDKMPKVFNMHTTKHFEKSWRRIKKIKLIDLPKSLHNKKIIQRELIK